MEVKTFFFLLEKRAGFVARGFLNHPGVTVFSDSEGNDVLYTFQVEGEDAPVFLFQYDERAYFEEGKIRDQYGRKLVHNINDVRKLLIGYNSGPRIIIQGERMSKIDESPGISVGGEVVEFVMRDEDHFYVAWGKFRADNQLGHTGEIPNKENEVTKSESVGDCYGEGISEGKILSIHRQTEQIAFSGIKGGGEYRDPRGYLSHGTYKEWSTYHLYVEVYVYKIHMSVQIDIRDEILRRMNRQRLSEKIETYLNGHNFGRRLLLRQSDSGDIMGWTLNMDDLDIG